MGERNSLFRGLRQPAKIAPLLTSNFILKIYKKYLFEADFLAF
jgi:hypothetical protein